MNISELHQLFLKSNGVVIDSRKVQKNDFFIALKGENFDANSFAKQALDNGALCVVIDNSKFYLDKRTILVQNSLTTLQELSSFHRKKLGLPIIALTGSNGKTTTKELIKVVLSEKFNVKATEGNLNNHIGVPLTLLSFNETTEIGIVEMGANHQREIDFLCQITQPDLAYITNFGKAHLEGFGGFEGVIKGKSELYEYIEKTNQEDKSKIVFVNLDDDIQVEKTKTIPHFSFSFKHKSANVFLNILDVNPFVKVSFRNTEVQSKLIGNYNAFNIAAAIAIGRYYQIEDTKIKNAIESYVPTNNRSQIIQKNSNKIILDAYNANPSSMKAAIENFVDLDEADKIMILGDMFELGDESLQEHKNIVIWIENSLKIKTFFVGEDFYSNQLPSENSRFFKSFDQLKNYFSDKKTTNKTILIKGSRGMALERIVDFL